MCLIRSEAEVRVLITLCFRSFFIVSIILLSFFVSRDLAFAHRDDFIDETLVYLTLEKGEIEPEYWFDFGHQENKDSGKEIPFLRHNFALEYGITEHWMIDGRSSIKNARYEGTQFDSGRFETRYRFFEEGAKPIDVAVSLEANTERNEDGRQEPAIEPRFVLSKDFKQLNLTLNLPEEIFLKTGELAFVPAFGFRYNTTHLLRFGCEMRYNTHSHEDSVIPQIWFALPHDITIKLGYSFGFNHNEESFGRVALEKGF